MKRNAREVVGKNLLMYRTFRGDRLADVAEGTGITSATLSRYENARRDPSVSQLEKLSEYYGCSLADLVTERESY